MATTTRRKSMAGKKNGGRKDRPKSHETPAPAGVPRTALEEKQSLLAHHVRMVARGLTNGLFVSGTGGCGKSKVIAETLAAEGVNPVLLNSHVTPLSLYAALSATHPLARTTRGVNSGSPFGNDRPGTPRSGSCSLRVEPKSVVSVRGPA